MNKIQKFVSEKGLYKIAFCICALITCFITVIIAEFDDNKINDNNLTNGQEVFDYESVYGTDVIINNDKEAISDSDSESLDRFDSLNEDLAKEADKNAEPEEAAVPESTNNETSFDTSFAPPHMGEIIKPFSVNSLIYSKTMDDWRIHEGIDIGAEKGSDIFAAQEGKVTFVGYDICKGYVVKVQNGGFECVYASLSSELPVSEGDIVKKGQYIGTVSDSQIEEVCDDSHLHFEIYVNGECVNPEKYIYK